MKLLQFDKQDKSVSLNFMWLPTWLGMNAAFKKQLEKEFASRIEGATSDQLEELERAVLDYIVGQFPIPGLRDYLDGMKFVDG